VIANRLRRSSAAIGALLALGAAQPLALAQPADQALAETLFEEGKRLMEQGHYPQACPKLAESQRLDPGGGTLIALALCHEAEGKTATAWAEFTEALALARQANRFDREQVATEHIAALEGRLARIVVKVPDAIAATPGFEIARNGVALRRAAWGVATPVDPGEHVVTARAPSKKPWKATVRILDAQTQTITVTPLEGAPLPPEATPTARIAGYVVGGIGIAGIAVGAGFGASALSRGSDVNERCPEEACTDPGAVSDSEVANRDANVANIAIGAGIAALAVGVVLLVVSRGEPSERAASRALAGPRFAVLPRPGGGIGVQW
jgi:tetratricopeptide (TPR) repeat protein